MKASRTRKPPVRALAAFAVVAAACLGSGAAAAETPPPSSEETPALPAGPRMETVYISGGRADLRFVAPRAVDQGDLLRVVNRTDPKRVGPLTFSLVERSLFPRTRRARQRCFARGHICGAIASWHGAEGSGPPAIRLVTAGADGWDTMGGLDSPGDSWFAGRRRGASIVQPVSAEAGTTITFICASRPWMHGSIAVLPAGS